MAGASQFSLNLLYDIPLHNFTRAICRCSDSIVCVRSFALQEAQRIPLQRGQWKCGICGQTVRGSHHLDAHMEDEHQDQIIEVRPT